MTKHFEKTLTTDIWYHGETGLDALFQNLPNEVETLWRLGAPGELRIRRIIGTNLATASLILGEYKIALHWDINIHSHIVPTAYLNTALIRHIGLILNWTAEKVIHAKSGQIKEIIYRPETMDKY